MPSDTKIYTAIFTGPTFDATGSPIAATVGAPVVAGSLITPEKGTYKVTVTYEIYYDATASSSSSVYTSIQKNGVTIGQEGTAYLNIDAGGSAQFLAGNHCLIEIINFNGTDQFTFGVFHGAMDGNYVQLYDIQVILERIK